MTNSVSELTVEPEGGCGVAFQFIEEATPSVVSLVERGCFRVINRLVDSDELDDLYGNVSAWVDLMSDGLRSLRSLADGVVPPGEDGTASQNKSRQCAGCEYLFE